MATSENSGYDYSNFIEALQNKEYRELFVSAAMLQLHEECSWSDQYHDETKQGLADDEYWFEYLDTSSPVLGSCDINIDPHQRYINIKDQLDENHIWTSQS